MTINIMPASEARARNSAPTKEAEAQAKETLVRMIDGAVRRSVGRSEASVPIYDTQLDVPMYSQKVLSEVRAEMSKLGYSTELSRTWLKISWDVNNG